MAGREIILTNACLGAKGVDPIAILIATMHHDHGFTPKELRELRSLKDPHGIQKFLDAMPYHLADTAWSPRVVLRENASHCFAGAMFAAAAFPVEVVIIIDWTIFLSIFRVSFISLYRYQFGKLHLIRAGYGVIFLVPNFHLMEDPMQDKENARPPFSTIQEDDIKTERLKGRRRFLSQAGTFLLGASAIAFAASRTEDTTNAPTRTGDSDGKDKRQSDHKDSDRGKMADSHICDSDSKDARCDRGCRCTLRRVLSRQYGYSFAPLY